MGIKVILFADDQGAISKDEENVQGAFRILSRRTDSCNFKISTKLANVLILLVRTIIKNSNTQPYIEQATNFKCLGRVINYDHHNDTVKYLRKFQSLCEIKDKDLEVRTRKA